MSIQPDPGKIPANGGFRRRVILELTVGELPLLDAARERHGTIRQAVLEALRAAGDLEGLRAQLEKVEAEVAKASNADGASSAKVRQALERERKATAKLQRDLQKANEALGARERSMAASAQAERRAEQLEGELERVEQALEDREEEMELLQERAVEELYCARCDQLVAPRERSWQATKEGHLAYHAGCGDHGPGILGAASWLAHRSE
jgi:DNA repair exonuclease SbcCD ATPase subunit